MLSPNFCQSFVGNTPILSVNSLYTYHYSLVLNKIRKTENQTLGVFDPGAVRQLPSLNPIEIRPIFYALLID